MSSSPRILGGHIFKRIALLNYFCSHLRSHDLVLLKVFRIPWHSPRWLDVLVAKVALKGSNLCINPASHPRKTYAKRPQITISESSPEKGANFRCRKLWKLSLRKMSDDSFPPVQGGSSIFYLSIHARFCPQFHCVHKLGRKRCMAVPALLLQLGEVGFNQLKTLLVVEL